MPAAAPAFTAQTLPCLRALTRHNTRAWFHEHRVRYDAHVHAPMLHGVRAHLAERHRVLARIVAAPASTKRLGAMQGHVPGMAPPARGRRP